MSKYSLSNFKKVRETETHAVFKRPDGHELHIARNGLRPELQKQLAALPIHAADGALVPEPPAPGVPPSYPVFDPNPAPPTYYSEPPVAPGVPPSGFPSMAPPPPPSFPSESAPNVTAGAEMQASAAPPAPQAPGLGAMYSPETINKVFGQQADALKAGNQGMQSALAEGQKAQAAYAESLAAQQKEHQAHISEINKGLDADREAYTKGQIDPNHVWNSKSTASKVSTIIGLFLGGIGAGMTHGENPALSMLNKSIDRDIESQKLQLNKQHTLYSMNLQKYQNENAADAATKLQMYNAMQAKLQLSGMKMQGAEAQQRFQMGMAGIEQAKLPYLQQLAQFGMMQQAQTRGIPAGSSAEMFLPEKFQERLVNVKGPDGKIIKVPAQTKEDAEKFKAGEQSADNIETSIKKLMDLNKEMGPLSRHVWGTTDRARIAAASGEITTQLSALQNLNRLTETEMHEFKKMVPDESTWNTEKGQTMLNDLMEKLQAKRASFAKNYLSNYSPSTEVNFTKRK